MAEGTQPVQQSESRPRPALLPEDIEAAALSGELGCSFAEHDAAAPLLVAEDLPIRRGCCRGLTTTATSGTT